MVEAGAVSESDIKISSVMDPGFLLRLPPRVIVHRYDRRDTMLYALGVGAGQRPDHNGELSFVLEDRLVALPTMAVILAYPGFWQMDPQYGIDWRCVLHAEQSCEFHAPLPVEGEVRGELSIDAIVDKGAAKGALLRASRQIYNHHDNRLLATVRQISFLRGDGGRGGGGAEIPSLLAVPTRAADQVVTMTPRPEQALIYRLSGDFNPLHADPSQARAAGFAKPLLHGLCTYGFAGRAILTMFCGDDPTRLKALKCRFTAPVFPGEALNLRLWRVSDELVAFQVTVPTRRCIVMDRGLARIVPLLRLQ